MADEIKFVEGTDPSRPGVFFVGGTDALTPKGMQMIFERIKGRPATADEIAMFQKPIAPKVRPCETEPR